MKDVVGEVTNHPKKAELSHVMGGSGSRRPSKEEHNRVRSVRRKFLKTFQCFLMVVMDDLNFRFS